MAVHHPAKYSDELLPVMARYVDGAATILDPFAGTGRVGMLRQHLTQPAVIIANELERAWAAEAVFNGCDRVIIGDAREVPFGCLNNVKAVVTSPAYGNRMADVCDWAPGRKHSTYTSALRETVGDQWADLQPGNAGAMQWGDDYRRLHREVWTKLAPPQGGGMGGWALHSGGRLVLNIADHYRNGITQGVPEWHVSVLLGLGFRLLDWVEVETPRYGFGANSELRCPELVIVMESPNVGGYRVPWVNNPEPRDGWLRLVPPEPQQIGLPL